MRKMDVGLSLLVVGVLVSYVGGGGGSRGEGGGKDIPAVNQVQMEVDKDIMKHTIEYLRNQLIACVSQSKITHRRKRKAHSHLHQLLEYEVEMDMLKNTKEYLTARLVACRQTTYRLETLPNNTPSKENVVDSSVTYELSKSYPPPEGVSAGDFEQKENSNLFGNQDFNNNALLNTNNKYLHRPNGHVSRHHGSKSSEQKHRHENELKIASLARTINATTTTTTASSISTTDVPAAVAQTFVVNGRAVQCGSYIENSDATSFICRNILVDDVWRLPNFDLCLPGYNPNRWRHLAHIQSRTFSVLDLKSLCSEMGRGAGLGSKVRDVRVVWDCGDTHYRLTFVQGKWTGSVEDNGYLRDLECVFNT